MAQEHVEIWLPIAGYEGIYDVSSLGRVRSHYRNGKHSEDRCLKPFMRRRYPCVNLRKHLRAKSIPIHRLVLETFIGKRPLGMQCGHSNGNCNDARLCNLRWITQVENEHDKRQHGTALLGERHHQAKVTNEQARHIAQSQLPTRVLSKQYSLSRSQIQRIRNGSYWKEIVQCHV